MDQVGERLDQLLAQPWLQGGQSTKLGDEEAGGHSQQGWDSGLGPSPRTPRGPLAVGGAGHNTKVATLATAFVHYYGTFDFSHNIYVGCLVVWFRGRFAQKYN